MGKWGKQRERGKQGESFELKVLRFEFRSQNSGVSLLPLAFPTPYSLLPTPHFCPLPSALCLLSRVGIKLHDIGDRHT
jgi:hypothetical protein